MLTCYTTHVILHMLYYTCYTTHVILHMLYYTCYTTHVILHMLYYILRLFVPLRYRRSNPTAVVPGLAFSPLAVGVFERFSLCNIFGILYISHHYSTT